MAEQNSGGRVSRFLGQYIIKYYFQFKFSLIVLGIVSVCCFALWFEANTAVNRMIDSNMVVSEDAVAQIRLIGSILAKTGVLICVIAFGFSLFLSHFVAGPIYRFEKIFQELQNGNLGIHVRIRKNDEFQETAEILNNALLTLRNKLQKERESFNMLLEQALKQLRDAGRADDAARLQRAAAELSANPAAIRIPAPK